jgi:hypothetical protein
MSSAQVVARVSSKIAGTRVKGYKLTEVEADGKSARTVLSRCGR